MLSSCGQTESETPESAAQIDNDNSMTIMDTSAIAVIPFDTADDWLFKNAQPTSLNTQEMKQIEKILADHISEYNVEQKRKYDNLSKEHSSYYKISDFVIELDRYKRQYIPVINENGEKEVWINCFCDTWDRDWKTEIITVDDGGNCYFQLKINLDKNEFYDFWVNGEA